MVAGATRGAGRGIFIALGELGATFYCSGRSSDSILLDQRSRHEIIEETAVPLMRDGGVIVKVPDGDALYCRGNLCYDVTKVTVIRLEFDMVKELRDRSIASIAVTPGFLRSEAMLDDFGFTLDSRRDANTEDRHFDSPLFVAVE